MGKVATKESASFGPDEVPSAYAICKKARSVFVMHEGRDLAFIPLTPSLFLIRVGAHYDLHGTEWNLSFEVAVLLSDEPNGCIILSYTGGESAKTHIIVSNESNDAQDVAELVMYGAEDMCHFFKNKNNQEA